MLYNIPSKPVEKVIGTSNNCFNILPIINIMLNRKCKIKEPGKTGLLYSIDLCITCYQALHLHRQVFVSYSNVHKSLSEIQAYFYL